MVKKNGINRRDLLRSAVGFAALSSVPTVKAAASFIDNSGKADRRSLRFAHFTDIHLEPKRGAGKGLTKALNHMQNLSDKPQMLITGGDHVMDSICADDNWTTVQYRCLKEVMEKECEIPVKYCIGNHDAWGWDKKSSKTTGNEPNWGKKRPVKEFSMPARYYSFDHRKWHIIIMDSTHEDNGGYLGCFDDEQFEWLKNDLSKNKNKFVTIVSHIPILSVAAFFDGENEKSGHWSLPKQLIHVDARKLKDLFAKNPNVKLCISGHLHLVDRIEYNGVTYICDGAVSAAWWRGDYQECDEGYGVFDLFDDGSFEHQYVSYDWTPIKD